MQFVNLGNDFFVKTNEIKMVISSSLPHAHSGGLYTILKKAKEQNRFVKTFAPKALCYIVLNDNLVIASPLSSNKMIERISNVGEKFISVITDLVFISVSYIRVVQSAKVLMTANTNVAMDITDTGISFCQQREGKNTRLILNTGEMVTVSRRTDEFIEELNKILE